MLASKSEKSYEIGKMFQFFSGKIENYFHPDPQPPDLKTD